MAITATAANLPYVTVPGRPQYKLEQRLGQGSFGAVYLARDTARDGRFIVVKHMMNGTAQEACIMRNLVHRHIVRYSDHVTYGTPSVSTGRAQLAIVMEYCPGGDLRTAIRKRRTTHNGKGFAEPQVRKWLGQMVSALRYCHVQHILHRDLKAENVLLTAEGNVKVSDFGFAKVIDSTTDFSRSCLGTLYYLPPEMFDHAPYNHKADVWCLGVMLFELMTLRRPFLGETYEEVCAKVRSGSVAAALRELSNNEYSEDLYVLCLSMLDKSPIKRPSSRQMLELPWLAQAAGVADVMQECSETQRLREDESWRKIMVEATLEKSVMLEMTMPGVQVNLREGPSLASPVLGRIQQWNIVEAIARLPDPSGEVVWLHLTKGYCIARSVNQRDKCRDLFRAIPEWRVVRPHRAEQLVLSPQGVPGGSDTQTFDQLADEPTISEGQALAMLDSAFQGGEGDVCREQMLRFLDEQGVPLDLTEHLLAAYKDRDHWLVDDMPWTLMACGLLRPLRRVYCIQFIRAIARHGISSPPLAAPAAPETPPTLPP